MTSKLQSVTFDCSDARALGSFWAEVLGWNVYFDDDPEVLVAASFPPSLADPQVLFIPVPEGKAAKNRVHLDVAPIDGTRDEEVARLIELGAALVHDHRTPDGAGWVWMTDPEGNEFCVVRSDGERPATTAKQYRIEAG